MGAVFAPTRFSLVRISIRDLVADGKSLVRNSGVGGGGENLILKNEGATLAERSCPPKVLYSKTNRRMESSEDDPKCPPKSGK